MGHLPLETDGTLALSRLDEITKRYEENPRRFFAPLANAYRKAGELSRSISLCQRYLQDQPGNLHGQVVYGRALFDAGWTKQGSSSELRSRSIPNTSSHCASSATSRG